MFEKSACRDKLGQLPLRVPALTVFPHRYRCREKGRECSYREWKLALVRVLAAEGGKSLIGGACV